MARFRFFFELAFVTVLTFSAGASSRAMAETEVPTHAEAIRAVIEADDRLGSVRNHATENLPVARAIEDYVAGLDALDLQHCPEDFVHALRSHRDAWNDSIEFFEQYAQLRGEMHDVFEAIRARDESSRAALESAEARIWSTWDEVEKAIQAHPPQTRPETN